MAAISSLIALGSAAAGAIAAKKQGDAASKSADAQTRLAEEQAALAREQWDYYKTNYQPLEKQLIGDAANYDTAERRDNAANSAMADQQREFDAGKTALSNRFASMGLDPSQGRFQSGLRDMEVSAAANKAGAGTIARRSVEQEGYNRRLSVAGLGRNIPMNVSNAMSAAQNGLSNSAQLNAAAAARTAGGIAYLGNKVGDVFKTWGGGNTQPPAPVTEGYPSSGVDYGQYF